MGLFRPTTLIFLVVVAVAVIVTVMLLRRRNSEHSVTPQARTVMVVDPATGQQVPMLLADSASGTNILAIFSLVFFSGPLGLIFGHIALSQIKKSGQNGWGLAVAGTILSYLFTAGWIIYAIVMANEMANLLG